METEYNRGMGLTTKEAAEFLGVTENFIRSLIYRGKLEAKKHGRDWAIDSASVELYKAAPKDKGGRPKKMTQNR